MTQYTLRTTVRRPYEDAVEAVRAELAAADFGILPESLAGHDQAGDTPRTVATDARQRLTAALAALENT